MSFYAMNDQYTSECQVGDLVELRSGLKGLIIAVESIGAKNIVGRAGVVDVVEVLTEKGDVGRLLKHQLRGVICATLS